MSKLTDKQEKFCLEYLKDWNATQAAIRAGYSKDTATQQASRLLSNVNVSKRVYELGGKVMERVDDDITDSVLVLKEIRDQGEKDSDRIKSIELLMRYHGAFEKDNTQKSQAITFVIDAEGEEPEIG